MGIAFLLKIYSFIERENKMKFVVGIKTNGVERNDIESLEIWKNKTVYVSPSIPDASNITVKGLYFIVMDSYSFKKELCTYAEVMNLKRTKMLYNEGATWFTQDRIYIYPEGTLKFFLKNIRIPTLKSWSGQLPALCKLCHYIRYIEDWKLEKGYFYFKTSTDMNYNKGKITTDEKVFKAALARQLVACPEDVPST